MSKMKFTDNLSREWQLTINVAAMRRAKANGIDLSMPVKSLGEYVFDDCYLCDALWAIVKPQADGAGITQEQFDAGLDGKVIEQAREALWDSLAEYFDPGKAEVLREALRAMRDELSTAMEQAKSATSSGSTAPKVS